KMAKSDGNSITPQELFTGDSPHISKGYSPMAIRFFMLQTHYRSTLDLTDEALQAAEKGFKRLMEANSTLQAMNHPGNGNAGAMDAEILQLIDLAFQEMSDDFNTAKALARLFELVNRINGLKDGHLPFSDLTNDTFEKLKNAFHVFLYEIFGLKDETADSGGNGTMDGLMQLIIDIRQHARENKDWTTSDKIRDTLANLN